MTIDATSGNADDQLAALGITRIDLLVATLVLGVLNAFLRPLLLLISLPLLIFTPTHFALRRFCPHTSLG